MADENYTVSIGLVSRGKPITLTTAPIAKAVKPSGVMQGIIAGVLSSVIAKGLQNIKIRVPKKQERIKSPVENDYVKRVERANAKLEEELAKKQDDYFKRGQEEQARKGWKYIREMEKENDKLIDANGKLNIEKRVKIPNVNDLKIYQGSDELFNDVLKRKQKINKSTRDAVKQLNETEQKLFQTHFRAERAEKDLSIVQAEANKKAAEVSQLKELVQKKDLEIGFIKKETDDLKSSLKAMEKEAIDEQMRRSIGQQVRRQREAVQMGKDIKPLTDPRTNKELAWQEYEKIKDPGKSIREAKETGGPSVKIEPPKFENVQKKTPQEIEMEDYLEDFNEIKDARDFKYESRNYAEVD
jgi:hypothetical protein